MTLREALKKNGTSHDSLGCTVGIAPSTFDEEATHHGVHENCMLYRLAEGDWYVEDLGSGMAELVLAETAGMVYEPNQSFHGVVSRHLLDKYGTRQDNRPSQQVSIDPDDH